MITNISQAGIDLIKGFEGYRSNAYQCSAGKWTIGYGHTLGVKQGDTCTQAQGEAFLRSDLAGFISNLNNQGLAKLTQNQYDALISLMFNIGTGAFNGSTLLKVLKSGGTTPREEIETQWKRWKMAGGVTLPGLVTRRAKEYDFYKTGSIFFLTQK